MRGVSYFLSPSLIMSVPYAVAASLSVFPIFRLMFFRFTLVDVVLFVFASLMAIASRSARVFYISALPASIVSAIFAIWWRFSVETFTTYAFDNLVVVRGGRITAAAYNEWIASSAAIIIALGMQISILWSLKHRQNSNL